MVCKGSGLLRVQSQDGKVSCQHCDRVLFTKPTKPGITPRHQEGK